MQSPIQFEVSGIPQTAGSKRSFVMKRKGEPLVVNGKFNGRVVTTDDNPKGQNWKNQVADKGSRAMAEAGLPFDRPLLSGALQVDVVFIMPRTKGHFRADGSLRPSAPQYHTVRPDVTKLWRCTEDALTGICWTDDSQIAIQSVVKRYGDRPGVRISIRQICEEVAPLRKSEPELAL